MKAITFHIKRELLKLTTRTRIFAESVRRNTGTKDELCERCRSLTLALEAFLREPVFEFKGGYCSPRYGDEYFPIKRSSLQENCNLCCQLAPFLHGDGKHDEFRLVWYDISSLKMMQCSPCIEFMFDNGIPVVKLFLAMPDRSQRPHPAYSSPSIRYATGKVQPIHPDFGLVKKWLNHCRDAHERICDKQNKLAVSPLRLIDCASEELCIAHPDCPYIALSYTWGDTALEEPLTGLGLSRTLPKTIQDAIIVARALDIPHLWVDRYCIDQSNADEVHRLVHSMDKIYSNAELTIVAAAGTGPTCGLPGIGNTPRRVQNALKVGTYTFLPLPRLGREIRESTWNSRGWTFQEMLLSRRRLVFTESEMYFQCRCNTFVESHEVPFEDNYFKYPMVMDDYHAFPSREAIFDREYIYNRLSEYYPRQLSFDDDILKAFEGIFTAYQEDTIKRGNRFSHFWGIPILSSDKDPKSLELDSFVRGLLFWIEAGPLRQLRGNENTKFPSWSWAACKARRPKDGQSGLFFRDRTTLGCARHRIAIHFTHLDGTYMSLAEYAARVDDYTKYFPWIDIMSWSIPSSIYCSGNSLCLKVFGPNRESRLLDDFCQGYKPDWDGRSFMVVFMYSTSLLSSVYVKGLLLEAVDDRHWRRVGIWYAYQDLYSSSKDRIFENRDLPRLIDEEGKDGPGAKWEMRTLRVV